MTLPTSPARRRFPPPYPYSAEPVTHPSAAPWNATTYAATPTPDGTGSVVHPDVIDFATLRGADWNGWRFWMAVTPYFNTDDTLENPCILVSQDGQTWQVPAGLVNPVYPAPPPPKYNSDTDLVWDPVTDELILIYRDGDLQIRTARSADGVTWPAVPASVTISHTGELLSPAVVRVGSEWILFGIAGSPRRVQRWSSADLVTWDGPVETAGVTGLATAPWHVDVTRHVGRFYMLVASYSPFLLYAASSADGLAWVTNVTPVISPLYAWDGVWIYRATLQPHEGGHQFRVWYSAKGQTSWRVGYTHIPLTEWPAV